MAMQVDVHGGRRPAAPHCNRSPAATFRLFPALFGHAADGFPGHVRAVVVDIRERILSSLPDLMAVCTMETLAVGNPGRGLAASEGMSGRRDGLVAWTPQRVLVSARVQRRWPSVVSAHVAGARLRFRCHATSGDGPPKKNYDLSEVIEKVVDEEEDQFPEEEKSTAEPLPEGEPSPFSPAIQTDDTEAFQGEGVSKDSLVEPPRGLQEGAASASIGEGLGASEESVLSADIGGSPKSGLGGHGRDWRVQATDEGSSFMAEAGILENDGGKSVDDYKLRAHIFSESAVFFSALKKRQS